MIKAFKILLDERDDIRLYIRLYILGKGPEEKNLKNLVKRLNLTKNIVFIDTAIPNQEMPKLYSECDLYIQPSIIEPFGLP